MEIFEEIKLWTSGIILLGSLIALYLSLFRTSKIINLKKLKSDDLKSRDFFIGTILNLSVVLSFIFDELELGISLLFLNMVVYVYLRMYNKIKYQLLDERENLLFYKALAKSGTLFAFLMIFSITEPAVLKAVAEKRLNIIFFAFLYFFIFNLTALFIFRKNEKMVEKANENQELT